MRRSGSLPRRIRARDAILRRSCDVEIATAADAGIFPPRTVMAVLRAKDQHMDVAAWLKGLGLERYEAAFRDNEIDRQVLTSLTADDLKEIGIAAVGHRRRLIEAIAALRAAAEPAADPAPIPPHTAVAERRQLTVMFCDLVGST